MDIERNGNRIAARKRREGIVPADCRDKIPLQDGTFTWVDEEDWKRLNKHVWTAHGLNNRKNASLRISASIGGKVVVLSRFIMNCTAPTLQIDHIDHNQRDNRKSNLRICTQAENCRNRIGRSKTGYRGVTKDKKRYKAYVQPKGRMIYCGMHDTPEEAALAYNEMATKVFGEYARLNIIV